MSVVSAKILEASFLAVPVMFAVAAAGRAWRAKRAVKADETAAAPPVPVGESAASGPAPAAKPPVLPATPGVAAGFFRPLDLLWMGFLFLTFFSMAMGAARQTEPIDVTRIQPHMLLQSIGFWFVLAGVTVLVVVARRVRVAAWLGLRWRGWPHVLWIAPAAVAAMWTLLIALKLGGYMEWMESLGGETAQDTVRFLQSSQDPLGLGLMAFAAVIVAPICEETVFRGYLYAAAKRFAGPGAAAVCSALLFAVAHGQLATLLPLFVLGLLLVWLYERTGSLWAPVAVHFCFNGATVLLQAIARLYHLPIDP